MVSDLTENILPPDLLERLQSSDPDRVRAAMLADVDAKERLLVLYAFHAELAKVPELVSEPMIGAIRYQWWRDAVGEIYEGGPVRSHEVATPLTQLLRESDIPRFWIDKLIDGRERDLDPTPFANLDDAISYCDDTSGRLLMIAARLCQPSLKDAEALSCLGRAWGLTGLARAWRFYHGSMLSELSFSDILDAAEETCAKAPVRVDAELFPATGYASLIRGYLSRLRKLSDPVQDHVSYGPFRKQLRMTLSAMSGKVR